MFDTLKDFLNKDYRWVHPRKRGGNKSKLRKKKSKRIKISDTQRNRIYTRDGYRCVLCGCKYDLCIHHRKEVFKGGTNDDDILVTLCILCHIKQHPDIAHFMLMSWCDSLIKEIEDEYFSELSQD